MGARLCVRVDGGKREGEIGDSGSVVMRRLCAARFTNPRG